MSPRSAIETDFLVIGGGCAGLRAAIELATVGRVLVLTKDCLPESATECAEGGTGVAAGKGPRPHGSPGRDAGAGARPDPETPGPAPRMGARLDVAALSDEDTIGLHYEDTLRAGDELSNEEAVRVLVEEGPRYIKELIHWGTKFDRTGSKLAFTRAGAHRRSPVLHAHGDSTGYEIVRVLFAKASECKPAICFQPFALAVDLLSEDGRVCGAVFHGQKHGRLERVHARAVLLATGGLGRAYRDTTNPEVATGDGVAMAFRAGAELTDLEFVQFHPTALHAKGAPCFLLSEELRGEGGLLRNMEFDHFMPRYHAEAEMAPREVVARAIVTEMARTRADFVYLDLTHRGAEFLQKRFPRTYATCMRYNLDMATDLIPVHPAAHYAMGGVATDSWGRTTLPGLFAAGETASTGLHGANRLASNSLLEGLVFGARVGQAMQEEATRRRPSSPKPVPLEGATAPVGDARTGISQLQDLLWKSAGIIRNAKDLRHALEKLEGWGATVPGAVREAAEKELGACSREVFEYRNLLAVSSLIARSALAREESRGAHYRTDFPYQVDRFRKHSYVAATHKVSFR